MNKKPKRIPKLFTISSDILVKLEKLSEISGKWMSQIVEVGIKHMLKNPKLMDQVPTKRLDQRELDERKRKKYEANAAYYKAYRRAYYLKNRDKMLESHKKYYQENKEYYAEYRKKYKEKHPDLWKKYK